MDSNVTSQSGQDPMKMIFNYDDVFFSFFYGSAESCVHRSLDFALNYVHSGEMLIDNGTVQVRVAKGECVFIPRDHTITMWKRPSGEERYCGIYMKFTRKFLRSIFSKYFPAGAVAAKASFPGGAVKLPSSVEIDSLFASMLPYFNQSDKPRDDFMHLKLEEGLLALLHIDERFSTVLFDFNEPWKIDIIDFLNQNYMYDLTIEELARYTGRSLSTFKRDFKKLSDLTPARWLLSKRLSEAYEMMRGGGRKISEVCQAVGFKNPSHFSTAFKRAYGVPPTEV